MNTYSLDLRERIIALYESGALTQHEVADDFGVSLGFVRKLWLQWQHTRDLAPGKRGGRHKPAFDAAALRRLHKAVKDHPDATLDELAAICGVACCRSTVYYTLARAGYRRKKNAAR
jgi:transposase